MTNQSARYFHYNQLAFGPCHYFRSISTGRRLTFRANEIALVRDGPFGSAVVESIGGYEFHVTSTKPEMIR